MKRLDKREDGIPVRPVLAKIGFSSPRLVIRAIEDAVAHVRADPTIDVLALSRVQLEAARIATQVHASNIDAKIDQLARQVALVKAENAKLRGAAEVDGKLIPLATSAPSDGTIDADFADEPKRGRGRPPKQFDPLMEPWEEADLGDQFEPGGRDGLPHNKGGRPKSKVVADLPDVPDSDTFNAAYEAFHERAHEDEDHEDDGAE